MPFYSVCVCDGGKSQRLILETRRLLGTVMGDTFPNHNNSSSYRNPTFYYIGALDPLGKETVIYG